MCSAGSSVSPGVPRLRNPVILSGQITSAFKGNLKLNLNPHAREREEQDTMNRNQTNRILFTKEAGRRP